MSRFWLVGGHNRAAPHLPSKIPPASFLIGPGVNVSASKPITLFLIPKTNQADQMICPSIKFLWNFFPSGELVFVELQARWHSMYRRTSISGTKKAQITFPLRHFFPLKVVK
jgi:hypothetical protein